MGYYVKGFDLKPVKLKIAKTSDPEIDDGPTPLDAVLRAIAYSHKILKDWEQDPKKVKEQKENLKQLGKLLSKVCQKN
jgi:hypothetical protein